MRVLWSPGLEMTNHERRVKFKGIRNGHRVFNGKKPIRKAIYKVIPCCLKISVTVTETGLEPTTT